MPRDSGSTPSDLSDYVRALLVAQRYTKRPIYLVPHVLVDRNQSGAAHRSVVDKLFGDRRHPGALRHLLMLLTLRHGSLRVADPINLLEVPENLQQAAASDAAADIMGDDDVALARHIRSELHYRMSEEERVVAGPRLSVYETLAQRVLQDTCVREAIVAENQRTGKTILCSKQVRPVLCVASPHVTMCATFKS